MNVDDDSNILSDNDQDASTMFAILKQETRNTFCSLKKSTLNNCHLSLTRDKDIFKSKRFINLSQLGLHFALDIAETVFLKWMIFLF
jgi:hypothetical protein